MRRAGVQVALALVLSWVVAGCSSTTVRSSEDSILLTIEPEEIEILGPTRGNTKSFQILFFNFDRGPSFLEAEYAARKAIGADLVIGRTRLDTFEGLLIPALWLTAIGVEDADDVPIIGWKVNSVAGMGVRFLPAESASSTPPADR